MLAKLAAAPINRLLRGESWALRRLQPYAGKTASFDAFPFRLALTITPTGEVKSAPPATTPDVTFRLTPLIALRALGGDEAAFRDIEMSGETELAQTIELVVRNVRWDAEEDLARIFGDVAGHRIASTGRALVAWNARTLDRAARSVAEFLTDEHPMLARRPDVEQFLNDVDTLRDDVERLSQRIERLASHAKARQGP